MYFEKLRVQTLVCQTAALRWRLHAQAWTLNGKQSVAKLILTCLLVFGIELATGLVNWYLMDPGFFGG